MAPRLYSPQRGAIGTKEERCKMAKKKVKKEKVIKKVAVVAKVKKNDEKVCTKCGHGKNKHYGTPLLNCNYCGCSCQALVL